MVHRPVAWVPEVGKRVFSAAGPRPISVNPNRGVWGVSPQPGSGGGSPRRKFRISVLKLQHFTRVFLCARLAFVLRVQQHMPDSCSVAGSHKSSQSPSVPRKPARGRQPQRKFSDCTSNCDIFKGFWGHFR